MMRAAVETRGCGLLSLAEPVILCAARVAIENWHQE